MSNKKLIPVILVFLILTAAVLVACNPVEVVSVAVTEDSSYKTEYLIGEDIDITGIHLLVKTSDGESYTVYAADVRQDLRILNFNSGKVREGLVVMLEYKGCTTDIVVNVKNADAAKVRYTVSFSTGEGSEVESESVAEYSKASAPADPVREGYAFDGWYKESTFNTKFNFATEVIDSDVVLYAKWSKLYYITFRVDDEILAVKFVKEGDTLADVPQVPLREGMDGAWSRETFTSIHTNINVNAEYNVKRFTVNFYYRDPVSAQNVLIKSYAGIPYNCRFEEEYAESLAAMEVPRKIGNTEFVSWDKSYANITSDLDVYGVYSPTKHTVTFGMNYSRNNNPAFTTIQGVTYGNPVSRPEQDPVRAGYAFGGWFRQAGCTVEWSFNDNVVDGDITLYAKWDKLYKIRFLVDAEIELDEPITESIVLDSKEYVVCHTAESKEGGVVLKPEVPAKRGYLGSWVVEDAALANIRTDLNVFASYSIISYTVGFYNYDGSLLKEESVEYGLSATAPEEEPIRNGYHFTGWSEHFSFVSEDLRVVADFLPNYYNIRVVNERNQHNQRILENVRFHGLIPLATPTLAGHRFVGWFTDNTYQTEWDIMTDILDRYEVVDGVVLSLYARWIPVYTITFYAEDGATLISAFSAERSTALTDDIYTLPEVPEKTGHTGEWQLITAGGTNTYNWDAPVETSLAFKPVYTQNSYTLRFYFPESEYATRTVRYGEKLPALEVPNPTQPINGRTFTEWRVGDVSEITVVSDMDIYSNFTIATYQVTWLDAIGNVLTVTPVNHGASANFPSADYELPARKGYTFSKWTEENNNSLNNVTCDLILRPEFIINIYPLKFRNPLTNEDYAQIEYGTVGTVTMEQSLRYGTYINLDRIMPDVPPETGKDFTGWQVKRGGDVLFLERTSDELNGTRWLFANGVNEEEYVLTGAFVVNEEGIYYVEDSVNIVVALQEGSWKSSAFELVFEEGKWKLVKGSDSTTILNQGVVVCPDIYYMIAEETTFESVFEVSKFNVTFHNESNKRVEVYEYASFVNRPSNPSKSGYIFVGWYVDEEYTALFDFDSVTVVEELHIYAKWEARILSLGVLYTLNATGTGYCASGVDESTMPQDGAIQVGNFYNGLPVTEVKAEAFKDNDDITSVSLPATVTKIGPKAFMNAVNLVSVTIPDLLEAIPDNCFNGCASLTTVSFGANSALTTIGTGAFGGCVNLSPDMSEGEDSFPAGLTTIKDGAFYGCSSFDKLYFPNTLVTIGDRAFARIEALSFVVFRRSYPCNLGAEVFANNGVLYNVFRIYVPDKTPYITAGGNWTALVNADKIYPYNDMNSTREWSFVRSVGSAGKAILTQYLGHESEVTIPTSVISWSANGTGESFSVSGVADYAFGAGVTAVTIPQEVEIGDYTFTAAINLENIVLGGSGALSVSAESLYNAYVTNVNLTTLTLTRSSYNLNEIFQGPAPANLKVLKLNFNGATLANAYASNPSLTEVYIGGSISSIAANSFADCYSLQKVYFTTSANSVDIGAGAFSGCAKLADFYGADNSNKIPDRIKNVGQNAFEGTKWLKDHSKEEFLVVGDGILYKYNGTDSSYAYLKLPDSIKKIAPYAFYGYSKLNFLVAGAASQLAEIGESAFEECASLEAIVLPASVVAIGAYAFRNDNKLASVIALNPSQPLMGADVLAGVQNMTAYVRSASAGYDFSGAAVRKFAFPNVAIDEDNGWVYGYGASLGSAVTLIKAMSKAVTVAATVTISGTESNVSAIADYALLRATTSLDLNVSVAPAVENSAVVFGGVTNLTALTVRGAANAGVHYSVSKLINQNSAVTQLRTDAKSSVRALTGVDGGLPARIDTVNIIGFDFSASANNKIADYFLKDSVNVRYVYVEKEGVDPIALEDNSIGEVSAEVGTDAFGGTAWKDAYEGDFITILGGNLIDYKGRASVAEISEGVTRINGGAFRNASDIAVVYVPETVTYIDKGAFAGATHLVKLFMQGNAPALGEGFIFVDESASEDKVPEIFVPSTGVGYTDTSSAWYGWTKITYNNVEKGKNLISEKTTGGITEKRYEQYILNLTSGRQLLFYKQYTERYAGTELISSVNDVTAALPASINAGGTNYNSYSLGKNVFIHSVTTVRLSSKLTYSAESFANVEALDKIILDDVNSSSVQSAELLAILKNKSVRALEYDGSKTLDELLGTNSDEVRVATLKAIGITEGVTETVKFLLRNWNGITEVTFPASIKKVGPNSLENTAWYANYPGQFVVVGAGLLYKYKGVSSTIYIPASVRIVNIGAFSSLQENGSDWIAASSLKVTSIQFENGSAATDILDYAFAGCQFLNRITLPSTMRNIADNAFDNTGFSWTIVDQATNSKMLIVSGDKQGSTLVKYVGTYPTVVIPESVKVISAGAFRGNTHITSVDASSGILAVVCEYAFQGCTNLETVNLPTSLQSVGKDALHNTKWLYNRYLTGQDAILGSNSRKIVYHVFSGVWNFVITSDIMSVTDGALIPITEYGYTQKVTRVTLRDDAALSADDMYALLSSPDVDSFLSDGTYALSALIGGREPISNIKTLAFEFFGTSRREIAENYAYGWSSVTGVTMPGNVKRIGAGAFRGTAWYNNQTAKFVKLGNILVKYNGTDEEVVIGDSDNIYVGIAEDVFRNNTTIKRVYFNRNFAYQITEIPKEAFAGCTSLEYVGVKRGNTYTEGVPEQIVNFGEDCFRDTPWLQAKADANNGFVIVGGSIIAYLGNDENLVIPAETTYIYSYVFRGNQNVVSVTFDRYCNIESIGANVFRDCVNLERITLCESITEVDKSALSGTAWLESGNNSLLTYVDSYNGINRAVLYVGNGGTVTIPSAITEIMPKAFSGATNITRLVINGNSALQYIPAGAFADCTALVSVTIDSSRITIGDGAFTGTPYLAAMSSDFVVINGTLVRYNGSANTVILPASVKYIDVNALSGNNNILTLDMSATGITEIAEKTFEGCANLANVIFASSTYKIGSDAFIGTAYLQNFLASAESLLLADAGEYKLLIAAKPDVTAVTVPAAVKYIARGVFQGNESLTSVTFSAQTELESGAFVGCSALNTVTGAEYVNLQGDMINGTPYAASLTSAGFTIAGGVLIAYSGEGGDVVIPATVRHINAGVFTGNASLTSLSFAESADAVTIDKDAFRNCVNLAEVNLTENVEGIGYRAFYNTAWAKGLGSDFVIVSGKLLSYLGEDRDIAIPEEVTRLNAGVFNGNGNILRITFAEDGAVEIGASAFEDCSKLNSIALPNSNVTIGEGAFRGTEWYNNQSDYVVLGNALIAYKGNSQDIAIPENVTYIYDYVFAGNASIYRLTFVGTSRLTAIKGATFAGCVNLAEVALPDSVVELDVSAFAGTAWLANYTSDFILVGTRLVAYKGIGGAVVIPVEVQTIGNNVFTGNTAIASVSFASGSYVRSIPVGAFAGCTALTSVTFPEQLNYVGEGAFSDTAWYAALPDGGYIHNGTLLFYKGTATEYTIPEEVTYIAADAFKGSSVTTVTVTKASPSALNPGTALRGISEIYVPAASYIDYSNNLSWSEYYSALRRA